MRDMPIGVPSRLAMLSYLELAPVMTALPSDIQISELRVILMQLRRTNSMVY